MDSLDIKFGKYTLIDKIGDGGMAEVYRARVAGVAGFEKVVALKKIHPSLSTNERFRQNFVNEARICGQLHHHNVVEVYEFDQVAEAFYLAMEYIDGLNLEELLEMQQKRDESLPNNVIVAVMAQALEGLSYAHNARSLDGKALNVIHRDLKPSNILIDHSGVVKIVDFGVAKADMDRYATQEMTAKGTASYMAPEQVLGEKKLTYAVDIFAAGAILYELICEKRLFDADHVFAILKRVATSNSDKIVATLPERGKIFAPILHKLLAKDPAERVKSASEIVKDLKALPVQGSIGPRALEHFLRDLEDDLDEAQETIIDMVAVSNVAAPIIEDPEDGELFETGPTKVAFMPETHPTTTHLGPALTFDSEVAKPSGAQESSAPPSMYTTGPTRVQGSNMSLDGDIQATIAQEGTGKSITQPSQTNRSLGLSTEQLTPAETAAEDQYEAAKTIVAPYSQLEANQGQSPPLNNSSLTLQPLPPSPAVNNGPVKWLVLAAIVSLITTGAVAMLLRTHPVTIDFASTADNLPSLGGAPRGVKVEMDGQLVCYTPCSHQVSVRGDLAQLEATGSRPGYKNQKLLLNIASDSAAPQSFVFDLQSIPQHISIHSKPEGARILLDGQPTGRFTPATLRVPSVGRYKLLVELEGYDSLKQPIEVTEDNTSFSFELAKFKP